MEENGKKVAIDHLEKGQSELFKRMLSVETDGCTVGKFLQKEDEEMKQELKANRRLLWIILLVLAATQGPQILSFLIRGI